MDWRLYGEFPRSISPKSQATLDPTLYGPNSRISSRSKECSFKTVQSLFHLTLEVSRLSCLSGSMLALDCSFLAHDQGSNKSSPFVTNTCLDLYNGIVLYLVINMIFDSCLYTVVLTSCMDTFYCFSLYFCCLMFCSLSRNKITSDGVHELAGALQASQSLRELK